MSRNLASNVCVHCDESVVLEEHPRPITQSEAGPYFSEFETMLVANAHCPDCGAKYLAWCRQPTQGIHSTYSVDSGQEPCYDLSYRSTFNDEPGPDDLPKHHIVFHIDLERVPFSGPKPKVLTRRRWLQRGAVNTAARRAFLSQSVVGAEALLGPFPISDESDSDNSMDFTGETRAAHIAKVLRKELSGMVGLTEEAASIRLAQVLRKALARLGYTDDLLRELLEQ